MGAAGGGRDVIRKIGRIEEEEEEERDRKGNSEKLVSETSILINF